MTSEGSWGIGATGVSFAFDVLNIASNFDNCLTTLWLLGTNLLEKRRHQASCPEDPHQVDEHGLLYRIHGNFPGISYDLSVGWLPSSLG